MHHQALDVRRRRFTGGIPGGRGTKGALWQINCRELDRALARAVSPVAPNLGHWAQPWASNLVGKNIAISDSTGRPCSSRRLNFENTSSQALYRHCLIANADAAYDICGAAREVWTKISLNVNRTAQENKCNYQRLVPKLYRARLAKLRRPRGTHLLYRARTAAIGRRITQERSSGGTDVNAKLFLECLRMKRLISAGRPRHLRGGVGHKDGFAIELPRRCGPCGRIDSR
jgi:hypothetical protein